LKQWAAAFAVRNSGVGQLLELIPAEIGQKLPRTSLS
jgi:hypothetical protein